jgi:hypothetical protein
MIIEISKPELETLIRERMASGEFKNVEDALIEALKAAPVAASPKAKQSLARFLLESPLRDSGLNLDRERDYPR